jgi:hypothetical protein
MSDLRPMGLKQISQLMRRRATPDRSECELYPAYGVDRFVVHVIFDHLVPVRSEQGDLGCDAPIFAARVFVEVMRHHDFHRGEDPPSLSSFEFGRFSPCTV